MRRLYNLFLLVVVLVTLAYIYARELYALRLWAWFAARDEPKRRVSFQWFLDAYDRRQAIFRGEIE